MIPNPTNANLIIVLFASSLTKTWKNWVHLATNTANATHATIFFQFCLASKVSREKKKTNTLAKKHKKSKEIEKKTFYYTRNDVLAVSLSEKRSALDLVTDASKLAP